MLKGHPLIAWSPKNNGDFYNNDLKFFLFESKFFILQKKGNKVTIYHGIYIHYLCMAYINPIV